MHGNGDAEEGWEGLALERARGAAILTCGRRVSVRLRRSGQGGGGGARVSARCAGRGEVADVERRRRWGQGGRAHA